MLKRTNLKLLSLPNNYNLSIINTFNLSMSSTSKENKEEVINSFYYDFNSKVFLDNRLPFYFDFKDMISSVRENKKLGVEIIPYINETQQGIVILGLKIISSSICEEDFFLIYSKGKDLTSIDGRSRINLEDDVYYIEEKCRIFISNYKIASLALKIRGGFLISLWTYLEKEGVTPNNYIYMDNLYPTVGFFKLYFNISIFYLFTNSIGLEFKGEVLGNRFNINDLILEIKEESKLINYQDLNYRTFKQNNDYIKFLKFNFNNPDTSSLKAYVKNTLIFFYTFEEYRINNLISFIDILNFNPNNSSLKDFYRFMFLIVDLINYILCFNKSPWVMDEYYSHILNKNSLSKGKKKIIGSLSTIDYYIYEDLISIIPVEDLNLFNRIWDLKNLPDKRSHLPSARNYLELRINSTILPLDFLNKFKGITIAHWKVIFFTYYFSLTFGSTIFIKIIEFFKSLNIKPINLNEIKINNIFNKVLNYYNFFFNFFKDISEVKRQQLLSSRTNLSITSDSLWRGYFLELSQYVGSVKLDPSTTRCDIFIDIEDTKIQLKELEGLKTFNEQLDKNIVLKDLEKVVISLVRYYICLFGEGSFLILINNLSKSEYFPNSYSVEDKINFLKSFSNLLIFIILNKDNN